MLTEVIGKPAMLEQTAEECAELAKACLKYARLMRDENPVYSSRDKVLDNLHEEIADALICIDELMHSKTASVDEVNRQINKKAARMIERQQAKNLEEFYRVWR